MSVISLEHSVPMAPMELLESTRAVSLAELKPNRPARIRLIEAGQDVVLQLEGLGLCAGQTVTVVKQGEPSIVQVYATRIGIASWLADRIVVTPADDTSAS